MKRAQALGLVAGGIAAGATFAPARAATPTLLRLGSGPGDSFAEGYYMRDGGMLRAAGLDADVTDLGNGGTMTAAVVSGTIDAAVSNVASASAAFVRGLPIVVIAGSAVYTAADPPTTALLVSKASPLVKAADFSGKTIGLNTLRDLQQAAVMTWLDKTGGNSANVKFAEIRNSEQLAALAAGRIDAIVTTEPWTTAGRADTRIVTKPYDILGDQSIITVWIANKTWVESNPAIVRKLQSAIAETAKWANRNKPATAAILEKYSKLSHETLMTMNRLTYADVLDAKRVQPIIDASAKYGFLPHAFPASEIIGRG